MFSVFDALNSFSPLNIHNIYRTERLDSIRKRLVFHLYLPPPHFVLFLTKEAIFFSTVCAECGAGMLPFSRHSYDEFMTDVLNQRSTMRLSGNCTSVVFSYGIPSYQVNTLGAGSVVMGSDTFGILFFFRIQVIRNTKKGNTVMDLAYF